MFCSESIRSNTLIGNIVGSTFFKGINIIFNLLLIRFAIDFIGEEKYGIWLAMLAFFTWFSAMEVGITSGLRNKITTLFSENNRYEIKSIITKGFYALCIVYICTIALLIVLTYTTPLIELFKSNTVNQSNLDTIFTVSIVLYFIHYIFFFLHAILLATHKTSITYLIVAIQNGILLLGLVIFKYSEISPSFFLLCIWFSVVPTIVWFVSSLISFKFGLKDFAPKINNREILFTNPFLGIDKTYFLMQICILIIFSTDYLIIINYLNGKAVVEYNIAFKFFNVLIVVFNLVLVPYWASFTEASNKNDYKWIKRNIYKLIFFWTSLVIIGVIMVYFSKIVYNIWIGKEMKISIDLSMLMCCSILLTCWNNIFAYFLNAISKTKIQLKLLIISVAINIPVSIYLVNIYGLKGVVFASCCALLPMSIGLPIQYFSVIKKMELNS